MFTGTINLNLITLNSMSIFKELKEKYPVTFTVQNDLPYVYPLNGYPGSGSHSGGGLGEGNMGYASIVMHGLPNTQYKYTMISRAGSNDGGLVYGTIQNWTRAFESNLMMWGSNCNTNSPVGSECYIQAGLVITRYITTDNNGDFSFLFLHCRNASHHFYGTFILYDEDVEVGKADFQTTR